MKARQAFQAALIVVGIFDVLGAAVAAPFVSEYGYQITPPKGWRVDISGQPSIDVFAFAPPENRFAANLNVLIVSAPGKADLDQILRQSIQMNKQSMQKYTVIKKGYITIGKDQAINLVATHVMGKPAQKLWLRQVVIPHGDKTYILSCTSFTAKVKKYEPIFSSLLKTFRWTTPKPLATKSPEM